VFGSGKAGFIDGSTSYSEFNNPTGLAFNPDSNLLYVSDSGNNLIREIDLNTDSVKTILGNGKTASPATVKVIGTNAGLNTPMGLVIRTLNLYCAMRGSNELGRRDIRTGVAEKIAGNNIMQVGDGNPYSSLWPRQVVLA